ncbi:hypothetical protein ACLB2K_011702 [Fragaria x ananassa]
MVKPNKKTNYVVPNPSVVRVGKHNVEYKFGVVKPKMLRCRPKLFKDVVSKFSVEKKVAVEEMGFGLLLKLQCEQLQLGLCGWLIDRFDPSKSSIEVHGKRFNLGPTDFENIMGVKDGGHDVEIRGSKADIQELKNIHFGRSRHRISGMSKMAEKLKEKKNVDDTFRVRSLTPIVAWGEKEEVKLVEWIEENGGFNGLDIAVAYDRISSIPISVDEDEVVAVSNDHTELATVEPQSQQKTIDDKAAAELEAKLGSEMSKIEGLTYWQVFQATNILTTNYDLLKLFLLMSEQSKKTFVLNLLEHGTHGL